ncbi:NYN domain-containing protein [Campylobacter sp. CNRCH_2014_2849]|uniref:NYN domain-containing protein n=1 Tax=unclassified Campylobacter TaxID=2593542 RepID=UPI0021E6BE8D|nr:MULTISPECIES: NYN domain-containing protein [unclassified Campylobacter]MCV3428747.1 NYN domain-containing protein [Campylobacter sp. IFREMER_LSEM_CL1904]MCV3474382.1 NYN domain-containing protein [Campylobacter sp. CNRCH_2014_2849]
MSQNHHSTAIFVDLENLRLAVIEKFAKKNRKFFDYSNEPQKLVDFCNACVFGSTQDSDLQDLYRIFFYTAKPLDDHPNKQKISNFLNNLESLNHTALRLGKLVRRGNLIVQKRVDMLLGIDMAEISIKRFVKKVVLLGYDSDMSPALKLARTSGVQTEIVIFDDLKQNIELSLKKHCDTIKVVNLQSIYNQIGII